ncbi:nitrite reductase small subunit NirD [Streptomyces sp. DSM 41527]|uniref:Nitrite reductase small subunit NirD n=1 Tax=Streptomyces mooreae TaxID=3075523 RepID=A0ABU2TAW1_9ACTN|nr:nitrite reductase small subunit NirD [Streptomyces sp. DSM 41527]MDT0458054.1 nitrite reductase small subunit NirD [Streptomyces sp. DSM 41527]
MATAITPLESLGSHTPLARPAAGAPATASTTAAASGAAATVEIRCPQGWVAVCTMDDLTPGRGVAALLPDGTQAALFVDRAGQTYAIANRDPFTGAQVLSRGLTGSADGRAFVASPLLKQRFDLASGDCLDDPEVAVAAYPVRTRGGEHDS